RDLLVFTRTHPRLRYVALTVLVKPFDDVAQFVEAGAAPARGRTARTPSAENPAEDVAKPPAGFVARGARACTARSGRAGRAAAGASARGPRPTPPPRPPGGQAGGGGGAHRPRLRRLTKWGGGDPPAAPPAWGPSPGFVPPPGAPRAPSRRCLP